MSEARDTYRQFASYYDLYAGQFNEDLTMYAGFIRDDAPFLEIGCGTGRVLKHLLSKGFYGTGIDISAEMLEIARRELQQYTSEGRLELLNHDLCIKSLERQFEQVIISFYTFNYIIEEPLLFLRHLRDSMPSGGKMLIDLFIPKTLFRPELNGRQTVHTICRGNRTVELFDTRCAKDGIEDRKQVFREAGQEITINTRRRFFRPEEMTELLIQAGFENILFSPDYDLRSLSGKKDISSTASHYLVQAVACNRE